MSRPIYIREHDAATMIEVAPGKSVELGAAFSRGLITLAELEAARRQREKLEREKRR
jgi:flagellar biosynthesis component FlhA